MKYIIKLVFIVFISKLSFGQTSFDSMRMVLPIGCNLEIQSIVTSKNNSVIATSYLGNQINIYNSTSGKALSRINYESIGVSLDKLSLSPNGKYLLASASNDGIIVLWNCYNGKLLKILKGFNGEIIDNELNIIYQNDSFSIRQINFYPNSDTSIIQLYEKELFISESGNYIKDLAVNKSKDLVLFYMLDKQLISYDIKHDSIVNKIKVESESKYEDFKIQFSVEGQTNLISEHRILLFDDLKNSPRNLIEDKTRLIAAYSFSGKYMIVNENEKFYLIDNVRNKTYSLDGQVYGFDRITTAIFSFDENYLYTSGTDGTIYSWNTSNGRIRYVINSANNSVSSNFITHSNEVITYIKDENYDDVINRYLAIWNLSNAGEGKLIRLDSLWLDGEISFVVSNNDSLIALTSTLNHSIYVIDLNSKKLVKIFNAPEKAEKFFLPFLSPRGELFKNLAITKKSIFYVVGDQLWDASKRKPVLKKIGYFIAFSDDGNYFVTFKNDNLLFYETNKQKKIKELNLNIENINKGFLLKNEVCLIETNDRFLVINLKNNNIVNVEKKSEQRILDFSRQGLIWLDNENIKFKNYFDSTSNIFEVNFPNNNYFQMAVSKDNKFFISSKDNCIKVWSINSNSCVYERIQLENNNWLVKLTNSPYYMCSKDASKMLHYVTPNLKVIGFEQLDPIYNRPDIVLDSIGKYFGGADPVLVSNYRQAWEKRINRLDLDIEKLAKGEIAVPNAEIVGSDTIIYENKEGNLMIKVSANDSKYPLRRFNVYVNEVPLYGSIGVSIANLKKQVWDTTVSIPLSVGENKIQVSVMNEIGLENFKYPTYVNYMPNKNIIAKTYYIGIGVDEFKDKDRNLKYCVKDVTDLANSFEGSNTEVKLFTNTQVTKENILGLKAYLNKTGINDKVIISCSSHGLLDDSLNFYLAMHDVDFENPKVRGLKYEELESLLDGIPARQKLLLLDACNSGENDKTELLKKELKQKEESMDSTQLLAARGVIIQLEEENKSNFKKMNELFVNVRNNTGSVIISAAGGQESALEAIKVDGKTIENGAFTYCILEYIKQNQAEEIKVNSLKQYAEKRVEEITNGKQNPTSRQETMEVDWIIR